MTTPAEVEALRERLLSMVCDEGGAIICHEAASALAGLQERVGELERDALRYRWLKANHLQLGPDCWIRTGDDLDDATDTALAESAEP